MPVFMCLVTPNIGGLERRDAHIQLLASRLPEAFVQHASTHAQYKTDIEQAQVSLDPEAYLS